MDGNILDTRHPAPDTLFRGFSLQQTVGLIAHRTKTEAQNFARDVIAWLTARNVAVRLDGEMAARLGFPELASDEAGMHAVSFIITLGGDGTILLAARISAPVGVPILSVHMGNFGFIAETIPIDLFGHLEAILRGEMRIAERMMAQVEVRRNQEMIYREIGLNEVVVKSSFSHLLRLKTHISGMLFATYLADGLIIATPTGSTAYALSAGGPLVHPDIEAFVIVPNNPHTLSARPLVIPCDAEIEVEAETTGGEIICAVDSAEPFPLQSGDRVFVRRASCSARLISFDPAGFYRKVRNRYLYGERISE